MALTIPDIEDMLGMSLQEHQREAAEDTLQQLAGGAQLRLCLYHRTGAGKTIASLACVALSGAHEVLVLAPPITHAKWVEQGLALGLAVTAVSHAKFRQKGFKLRRDQAVIVDEFHLLGGHTGKGWVKMDRLARGLQAPLVLASATPNYNDAERVYCIQHVLDPTSCTGGFLQFLYTNCETEANPFGMTPVVTGFRNFKDAEDYLKHLPRVHYVEDEAIKQVQIADVLIDDVELPEEFERYGLSRRVGRVMASQMEARHQAKRLLTIGDDGLVRPEVYHRIAEMVGSVATPVLVYCNSSTIAEALHATALEHEVSSLLVTGKSTPVQKQAAVAAFLSGEYPLLIGTATLATGTDGIDKMCDVLLIVDDTDDDSLRRQLMGRILPRGLDTDVGRKQVWRLAFPS